MSVKEAEKVGGSPAPAAPAAGAEKTPETGEEGKVTVEKGFVDRLLKERDDSREDARKAREEAENLRLTSTPPAVTEPPAPAGAWGEEENPRVKNLEREVSELRARDQRRESERADQEIREDFAGDDSMKKLWPDFTNLKDELKTVAKGHNLVWENMTYSQKQAAYNKVIRDNRKKLVGTGSTAPIVTDSLDGSGLPKGGTPKAPAAGTPSVKLTDYELQTARSMGISPERFAVRKAERIANAPKREVL